MFGYGTGPSYSCPPLTPGPLSRTMDDEPPLNSDLSFSLQDVFVCSEVDVESEIKNRTFYRLRFKKFE